jgi:hypothetical protein
VHLRICAGTAHDARTTRRHEVVKNDAGASAALPQDIENMRGTQRKSAGRPRQRRVLKEDPAIAPGRGCFAHLGEGIAPSFFSPVNRHDLEGKSTLDAGLAQFFAIIRHAVGGLVPPPEQQDRLFKAHFSTR